MTYPPSWNQGQGSGGAGDPWQGGQSPFGAGDPFGQGHPNAGGAQPWPAFGAPPPNAPPPNGKPPSDNVQWVIAGIAAVLVIALVVGGLLWKNRAGETTEQAAPATTSSAVPTTAPSTTHSSAVPTPTAAPTPPPPCNGRTASPGPNTPAGWQSVLSPRGLVYDVPPDWEVLSCTTLVGWEKPCPESQNNPFGSCPIRTMSGAAELSNPKCPKISIGLSGVPGAKNTTDIREAVRLETTSVADIYTSDSGVVPKVELGAPRDFSISGKPAVEVVATVTGVAADNCTAPNALHVMIGTTVPGQEGSVMFVLSMEYQGAADTATVDKMVSSLRLAG
ncbi:hypothetical protein O6072_21600 [Mycolicibacterium neoaurum]|uniref:hypothetical protein n=1 Tax=Mycolicibacterium neoaurum TaxID=1795 RepID=UPI00248B0B35|nr:hypothetical protein [Mycolicibacterium neoaurum]WBP93616.1 hypothetical protein O7W24_21100 [Mycolicibacterium neoaurum]WBS07409.1 hypothetical protein O6072_21600 [Mycolicibacterium neoaurum]